MCTTYLSMFDPELGVVTMVMCSHSCMIVWQCNGSKKYMNCCFRSMFNWKVWESLKCGEGLWSKWETGQGLEEGEAATYMQENCKYYPFGVAYIQVLVVPPAKASVLCENLLLYYSTSRFIVLFVLVVQEVLPVVWRIQNQASVSKTWLTFVPMFLVEAGLGD